MTTKNSVIVANHEASPPILNPARVKGASQRLMQCVAELALTDLDAADIVRLGFLPSNAVVQAIEVLNDDLGGTLTMDFGLSTIEGVVKDVDAFASAVALSVASTVPTDIRFEAADIANASDPVLTIAGDTEEPPGAAYVLTGTVVTSTTPAAGTLLVNVTYTVD